MHLIVLLIFLIIGEDEGSEDSSNSSNDEDIDPTLSKDIQRNLLGIRKSAMQQNSIVSLFSKLQSGITSKSGNSISSNINTPGEIRLRKKTSRSRRWKSSQRRKTFTGFLKEETEDTKTEDLPRPRPKSVFLPRHKLSVADSNNATPNLTPCPSRKDTFSSSVTTVIEHRPDESRAALNIVRKPPPDIVIDIEKKVSIEKPVETDIKHDDKIVRTSVSYSGSFEKAGGSIPASTNGTLRKKKKKKHDKSKDTWSKYLDPTPKRHEVYCALNSVKKRLRGNGRGVKGASKKPNNVHIQRQASSLILTEKKDSMK